MGNTSSRRADQTNNNAPWETSTKESEEIRQIIEQRRREIAQQEEVRRENRIEEKVTELINKFRKNAQQSGSDYLLQDQMIYTADNEEVIRRLGIRGFIGQIVGKYIKVSLPPVASVPPVMPYPPTVEDTKK